MKDSFWDVNVVSLKYKEIWEISIMELSPKSKVMEQLVDMYGFVKVSENKSIALSWVWSFK
jgi:hypothetical protein